jgi:hypothetical protein
VEGESNHSGKRNIVTDLLRRDSREGRAALTLLTWRCTFSAGFGQRAALNRFVGEEGVMVRYIAVGSYWMGVVCALLSVVGRLCDALGIAFVRISTRGNTIDVRSFLDAGLLFLFITIASVSYEWLQSRQRGS